jgi:hypothetical protein
LLKFRRQQPQANSHPALTGVGNTSAFDRQILNNSLDLLEEGRHTFRFDTFGDETFWGNTLKLHQAIQGSQFGGIGPGVSPRTALAVGLKVDVDALPAQVVQALKRVLSIWMIRLRL